MNPNKMPQEKEIKEKICKRHNWSPYWKVKIDGHYEKLCYECGLIKVLFKKKGLKIMNKKEQIKTTKTIKLICGIVEKAKQKNIKKILKRLNEMSPDDAATLGRILKV